MSAAKKWGKQKFVKPEGNIRLSQVVNTFGPGSMVDLVDHAVIVGGLDFWSFDQRVGWSEPRLREAIAQRFEDWSMELELSVENPFREPPAGDDQAATYASGLQVLEFPQWFVCQRESCRRLARSKHLEWKKNRYRHHCDDGKVGDCVPVRFVAACPRGHLSEFPWPFFCHYRDDKSCRAPLRLLEGATGDFSEVRVQCECGSSRNLSHAIAPEFKMPCFGERPWLGEEAGEECKEQMRLLIRTASNSYFPLVMSALAIPPKEDELRYRVEEHWDVLKATSVETLPAFRSIPKIAKAFEGYEDQEILEAVAAVHEGEKGESFGLRTSEFLQLTQQPEERAGELPSHGQDFFARTLGESPPQGVGRIVLCRKLREVRTQVAFSRLEPPTPDNEGEYDLRVTAAPLSLHEDWLPACEIRGEGIFLQLEETAVLAWENRDQVRERRKQLLAGYERWREETTGAPPFPGMRFYLLHSLSHLLITSISLECGYAASAIRERIYCAARDAAYPMAALLLSTGSAGSEGTLGGLVDQGRRMGHHLRSAWDRGRLCSNDPVCAGHRPGPDDAEERHLEGAACHGCLFIAESSCERFNRYLDRALVVPTLGHDPALAYFTARPE